MSMLYHTSLQVRVFFCLSVCCCCFLRCAKMKRETKTQKRDENVLCCAFEIGKGKKTTWLGRRRGEIIKHTRKKRCILYINEYTCSTVGGAGVAKLLPRTLLHSLTQKKKGYACSFKFIFSLFIRLFSSLLYCTAKNSTRKSTSGRRKEEWPRAVLRCTKQIGAKKKNEREIKDRNRSSKGRPMI